MTRAPPRHGPGLLKPDQPHRLHTHGIPKIQTRLRDKCEESVQIVESLSSRKPEAIR